MRRKKESNGISSWNSKILAFQKTHTLKETGDKFGITGERVRQIKNKKMCLIHDRSYYEEECSYCVELKDYTRFIYDLDHNSLMKEVAKQARNKKRDFVSSWRREHLIKILREDYDLSWAEIARLLGRDRTTVYQLYHKPVKKTS